MALDLDLGQFQDEIVNGKQYGPFIQRAGGAIKSVDVPRIEDLRGFQNPTPEQTKELHALLRRFGRDDARTLLERQATQLQRFGFVSGTARFEVEMQRLAESESKGALLAEARRTSEQYETAVAIAGNLNQEMIRIAEGPEPCELCIQETGITGTYAQLTADGLLPGGSSCLGGDFCLCAVMPVDRV